MLRFVPLFVAAVLLFLVPGARGQSVVINEIMYAPTSPEPEWIELFNYDSTQTVEINKWSVQTRTKATLPAVSIEPLGYLILTKDSTTLRSKRPGNYPTIQIALPNLRNTGDTIYLRDSSTRTIDSVGYQPNWGGSGGKSLERIDAFGPSDDRTNWVTSKDSSGATIARENSVRPLDYDIQVVRIEQRDSALSVFLRNNGKRASATEVIALLGSIDTISKETPTINSKDSQIIVLDLPKSLIGQFQGLVYSSDSLDQNRTNDSLSFIYSEPIPRDSIVINEIMFDPAVNSCEWIELYNRSEKIVSLLNTSLAIGAGQLRRFSIDTEVVLEPRSYAVVIADSLFYTAYPSLAGRACVIVLNKSSLNLSNDSSVIVFHSYDSSSVDSVRYQSSWHTSRNPIHTGVSLERVDPSKPSNDPKNWQSCTDPLGATPLAKNSAKAINDSLTALSTTMQFSPNPFSPDGDGFEDQSVLNVTSGDELDYLIRVRLFDARGVQVRTLADGAAFKVSSSIAFDGKNDRGQTLSPGLYAAFIELSSNNPPKVISKTIGVVIAGKRR